MIRQWFTVISGALDEMLARYPGADAAQRAAIEAQLRKIQHMNDAIVDGWLKVEEKLARLRGLTASGRPAGEGSMPAAASVPGALGETGEAGQACAGNPPAVQTPAQASASAEPSDPAIAGSAASTPAGREEAVRHLTVGRGYYELAMYREAAASFQRAVALHPESLAARMFLAMSHMHLREWEEAESHFQFIVRTAPHPKLKALGLNALGCIHAVTANLEQAVRYFRQACEADPGFTGAARNLAYCRANAGPLTLYFGGSGFGCT